MKIRLYNSKNDIVQVLALENGVLSLSLIHIYYRFSAKLLIALRLCTL